MGKNNWASDYLLGPLINTEPAVEDGPGSHFGNSLAGTRYQKVSRKTSERSTSGYPTPPSSASPTRTSFPEKIRTSQGVMTPPSPAASSEFPTSPALSDCFVDDGQIPDHHRRKSSLTARFPGDMSHRPLDMIRSEQRTANRRRRHTMVGADTIDRLDTYGDKHGAYHHDGPYDATLLARNLNHKLSPVAATKSTNREAIRATPKEYVNDSVRHHRPLFGTATVPPGEADRFGQVMNYTEGPNLNIEMGWRRWEGIKYHPDDIKGKGEPSFSVDRALKAHKAHRRVVSEGGVRSVEYSAKQMPTVQSAEYKISRKPVNDDSKKGRSDVQVTESAVGSTSGAEVRRGHSTNQDSSSVSRTLKSKLGSLRKKR